MSFRYNATGVEIMSGFPVAPEGVYNLAIVETEEKLSKNGDNMVSVRCEIDDKGDWFGISVWNNVTFLAPDKKGAGMAVHFLKAIGEPWEGEFDVEPSHWRGKRFKAKVIVDKYNGKSSNKIAFVISEDDKDEVPF